MRCGGTECGQGGGTPPPCNVDAPLSNELIVFRSGRGLLLGLRTSSLCESLAAFWPSKSPSTRDVLNFYVYRLLFLMKDIAFWPSRSPSTRGLQIPSLLFAISDDSLALWPLKSPNAQEVLKFHVSRFPCVIRGIAFWCSKSPSTREVLKFQCLLQMPPTRLQIASVVRKCYKSLRAACARRR